MRLINAYNNTYEWQNYTHQGKTEVAFSWKGHFINRQHSEGGYLNMIAAYPSELQLPNIEDNVFKKVINKDLKDRNSNRTDQEIMNKNGIVR